MKEVYFVVPFYDGVMYAKPLIVSDIDFLYCLNKNLVVIYSINLTTFEVKEVHI